MTARLHIRTPQGFASNFGDFGIMAPLVLGAVLGILPSCALGAPDAGPAAEDSSADEASAVVCTTGPYRCHAQARTDRVGQRISAHAAPMGYGPGDLQAAYRIDPSITASARPVVAIIDA